MALETLELDGSIGEGGGQVLRVAVALSAIISKPLHIFNIRKRRGNPGLRPQHIAAVKLVAEACRAEVRGLAVGSGELFFKPRRLAGGDFSLDTGTAGSITLILQSLLPVLSLGDRPSSFRLVGGTNNPMAPPIEYIEGVLLPVLERMGVDCEIELVRRGFYPRGGGVVRGVVRPSSVLHPIKMRGRTNIKRVDGLSYTCKLPQHISERMAATAEKLLYQNGLEAHLVREALTSQSPKCSLDPGAGLILTAVGADVAIGADRLGEVGVPAERVASETVAAMMGELSTGAPLDRHIGDMLVVWAALAEGESEYEVSALTSHTLTSVEVCRHLLNVDIRVEGRLGERGLVRCRGAGFKRFKEG